ncbi:MAG: ADP-ribosyl-[dinitrogen reductase] hydrolase [Anaeromyxobacter sp.]
MAPRSYSKADILDRARAAFLGLALGDALGATVEFMTVGEIRAAYGVHRELAGGGWLRLRRGQVTDDTELALCLARSLVARGGLELRDLAERFAAWLKGGPVDAGNTVRRGIRRYLNEGTLEAPPSSGDAGNGALMRLLPVALATLGDTGAMAQGALAQARLTHHHPLSDAACLHLGELIHLACLGGSLRQLRRASDVLVLEQPTFRFAPYRGLATGYVVDTLQTVLHWFFATATQAGGFEACLVATVNQGGDADTTGAVAGALAGAYHGPEALPARWLRRLDPAVKEEIDALVEPLVALSPVWRSPHAR